MVPSARMHPPGQLRRRTAVCWMIAIARRESLHRRCVSAPTDELRERDAVAGDFWIFVRMQNSRVARRAVDGPPGRPPLISPPASPPYGAQPGSARSLVTRQHRVLAGSVLPVGLNWRWATSSRWFPQRVKSRSALILLAHHGAVRRRDAIVRAGGWGSATPSAAPRSGRAGSTFRRSRAPHVPRVTRRTARGLGGADTDRAETNAVPQPLSCEGVANRREPAHRRRLPVSRR